MRSTILAYEWLSKCQSFIISSINHIHQDMSTESKGKYVFYNIQLSFTCHKLFLFVCITQTRGLYWLTMRNTSGELQGIGGSPLFPSIFIISIILIISGNQQRPRDTIYSLSTACMQRWRMRLLAHGTIVMSNVIFLNWHLTARFSFWIQLFNNHSHQYHMLFSLSILYDHAACIVS